jgi:uncharacterized protein (DUF952 family)
MIDIFHITRRADWQKALEEGAYLTDTLASQGFIHCSTRAQVVEVANRMFCGQHDLVLLEIDSRRVQPEIRRENLEGGMELFPHIYGPLNLEAVEKVIAFEPGFDGQFALQDQ